jgi:hypothetical protein
VATDGDDLAGHVAELSLTGGDGRRGLNGTAEEGGRTGAVGNRHSSGPDESDADWTASN